MFFTTKEADSEGWDLVPSNLSLTVPRRYFHYGTFC